jgi:hypothetical protein
MKDFFFAQSRKADWPVSPDGAMLPKVSLSLTQCSFSWAPYILYVIGVVVHGLWALTIPQPVDWDPAYYRAVATNIVEGEGAVTYALWNLTWIPEALPMPADLYWMPLPSRILVPFLWLWPAHGDQVVTVLLAAGWGPLAFLTARELGADRTGAMLAGILATTGLWYARYLSTPDSIALTGVLGGLAVLASARDRWVAAAGFAALVALARNDGFLFAPCLAFAFRGLPALAVAVSGPVAAGLWHLRNAWLVGEDYFEVRTVVANALHPDDFLLATATTLSVLDRISIFTGNAAVNALFHWLIILPIPAVVAMFWHRQRWMVAAWVYILGMPVVVQLLAPGVAGSGTLFRSGSVHFPLACAITALVLVRVGAWGLRVRDYHPYFLTVLFALSLLVFSTTVGPILALRKLPGFDPCAGGAIPEDAVVFATHPLLVEGRCNRAAVLLVQKLDAARADDLAARFAVRYAVAPPAGIEDKHAVTGPELESRGWVVVSDGLYRLP